MTIQKLPKWAERKFAELCSAYGASCHAAEEDDHGWDYLVELPKKQIEGLPLDRQPGDRTAFVQIKSERRGRNTADLKLTNALHFSNNPAPCFVVLIQADQSESEYQIHAVHFWRDLISRSLKKGRAATTSRKKANKTFLTVTFSKSDNHTSDLLKFFNRAVSSIGNDYELEKKTLINTLGYEVSAGRGTLTILANDIDEIIDHQLGFGGPLPVSEFEFEEERFGIGSGNPTRFEGGHVEIRSNPRGAFLIKIRTKSGSLITTPAVSYTPARPNLPDDKKKIRFKSPILESIYSLSGPWNLTLGPAGDTPLSLKQFEDFWNILKYAQQGPLDVQIWDCVSGQRVRGGDLSFNTKALEKSYESLEVVIPTLRELTLPNDPDFRVSIDELNVGFERLHAASLVIQSPTLLLTFNLDDATADIAPLRTCVYFVQHMLAGRRIAGIISRNVEDVSVMEGKASIKLGRAAILESYVFPASSDTALDILAQEYERHIQSCPMPVVVPGDVTSTVLRHEGGDVFIRGLPGDVTLDVSTDAQDHPPS